MSRRKKNLRAFLHQNPNATVEQAWDSAWEGSQKIYHAKRIAQLEARLEAFRWIPVEELLPDASGEYLVWFQERAAILPFNGRWKWGDESYMNTEHTNYVSHWMPIPPPPQQEEK